MHWYLSIRLSCLRRWAKLLNVTSTVFSVNAALLSAARKIERRDAEYLLCHALKKPRAHLLAHGDDHLSAECATRFELLVAAREHGTPVAYLVGKREFYGRDFEVTPDVLIPRPETEVLVDQALASLSDQHAPRSPCILDLGTGSGAVAVTLALEVPRAHIVAVDVSEAALRVAGRNARCYFCEGAEIFSLSFRKKVRDADLSKSPPHAYLDFVQSNWYAALGGKKFDLIVSNPPYVAAQDRHLSQGDLRFEPHLALTDQSEDGLGSIRTIIDNASAHLNFGGWLLFEHGYDQKDACCELLLQNGFKDIISIPDLAGIARVAGGRWDHPHNQ